MARSEVLPAVFAMADAHQAFSNRDVRRVAVGGVAQHDVVAAVGRVSPTDREREREEVPILRVETNERRSERCENSGFDDHESELWAQEEGIQR